MVIFVKDYRSHGEVLHLFLWSMQTEVKKERKKNIRWLSRIFVWTALSQLLFCLFFPSSLCNSLVLPEIPDLRDRWPHYCGATQIDQSRDTNKYPAKDWGGRILDCWGTFWWSSFLVSKLLSGFPNKLRKYYFYKIINVIKGTCPVCQIKMKTALILNWLLSINLCMPITRQASVLWCILVLEMKI